MKFISNHGESPMETIPKEEISEFKLKQYLLKDHQISLICSFQIADSINPFGNLTIERSSNLREVNGFFFADLLFDYYEYEHFQHLGKQLNINGRKVLKLPVTIPKESIIFAGIIPKEYLSR